MIVFEKEISMPRTFRILLFVIVLLLSLACSLITNPINNVKNTANTAQAIATDAIALASQAAPFETLIANPTLLAVGDIFNPQGAPVAEWNGIPVMPQATAGEEVTGLYSYKASVSAADAIQYYKDQLTPLGWSEEFVQEGEPAVMFYTKDPQSLTITIAPAEDGSVLIWLALQ
jgi:hypothetical protein